MADRSALMTRVPRRRPDTRPAAIVPHKLLAWLGELSVSMVRLGRGSPGRHAAAAWRRASHAASASPIGVAAGPRTKGQISSDMARQPAVGYGPKKPLSRAPSGTPAAYADAERSTRPVAVAYRSAVTVALLTSEAGPAGQSRTGLVY